MPAGVPVTDNQLQGPHAYEYPSSDAEELFAAARLETGASAITAFAGCHDGVELKIEDACP